MPLASLVGKIRQMLKNKTKHYSCPAMCKHTVLKTRCVVTRKLEEQTGQVHSCQGKSTAKPVFLTIFGSQSLEKLM